MREATKTEASGYLLLNLPQKDCEKQRKCKFLGICCPVSRDGHKESIHLKKNSIELLLHPPSDVRRTQICQPAGHCPLIYSRLSTGSSLSGAACFFVLFRTLFFAHFGISSCSPGRNVLYWYQRSTEATRRSQRVLRFRRWIRDAVCGFYYLRKGSLT